MNSMMPPKKKSFKKEARATFSKKTTTTKPTKKTISSKQESGSTSWGSVASWYDSHLERGGDTYHDKVVHPHLIRLLGDVHGVRILDLGCGQGQFATMLHEKGAQVTGIDLGKELVTLAEKKNKELKSRTGSMVTYYHGSADDLYMMKNESFDRVVCVLALQNMEKLEKVVEEVARVLTRGGTFTFVLNHPSFRNPRHTRWEYDAQEKVQYRRVDEYMRESSVKIDMNPGETKNKQFTVSFHRPLQVYIKALAKHSLAVTSLEEWVSHKESEEGPRQLAENKSRKEIPLFMCISAKKG